jgi:hypothetical protein
MARAYIIGNGPSRKNVDLTKLKGKTFGCNALYRDFSPDYLLSGDAGVIKEICKSKYPENNWCIFPDWSPVPIEFKDTLVEPFLDQGYNILSSGDTEYDHIQLFGHEEDDTKDLHIIGVNPKWRIINMRGTEEDPEFSVNFFAGSNALAQASIMGFDEIVLLGFDSVWNFVEDTYQNIYAGTDNYMREKETPRLGGGTDDPNSLMGSQEAQIKKVLDIFKDVKYYIDRGDDYLLSLTYDSLIK